MYVVFWRQAFVRDPVSYCLFPVIVVPNVINYKKKLKKGNTSQNAAPRNSISGVSSLLLSVCIWRYLTEIGVDVL